MQKVSVYLDEKGIPAVKDLVTQSVIDAICANFNELISKGLVVVQIDYTEPSYQEIIDDYGILSSIHYPYKPTIRVTSQTAHGAVMNILMPKS